jgi:hypothetical protein
MVLARLQNSRQRPELTRNSANAGGMLPDYISATKRRGGKRKIWCGHQNASQMQALSRMV